MGIEIFVFSLVVGLLFGAYYFWSRNIFKDEGIISPISGIFAVFLTIAILILFNGLWADIIPGMAGVETEAVRAKLIFQGFLMRSVYVLALVVGSLFLYFSFYRKGEKYSMVILPYFVGAMIMTARWLVETGRMIIEAYDKAGVYAILTIMIIAMSLIVFYVQQKKERFEQFLKKKGQVEKPTGTPTG